MSDERTQNLSVNRSFEDRVFARFDTLDARFDAMESRFDARFDGLDSRVQALEARALDTKPIWERALTEVMGVRQSVDVVKQSVDEVKQEVLEVKGRVESIEKKFDVMILDMMQLRGDQRSANKRMDAFESRPQ